MPRDTPGPPLKPANSHAPVARVAVYFANVPCVPRDVGVYWRSLKMSPYDVENFGTVYPTRADKCDVSHVVADTDSWEQKMADALEDMDEVLRYVKNHNLSFTIPYTLSGEEKQYHPDFIAIVDDGHGPTDPLNQIIEVTGKKKKTRRQRSPRPARFGFRPSTITAALDAGDSSR